MRKNGPRRLTATCASNSSGVVSSSVPREVSPAALTRQSTRPCAASTAATEASACAGSATSVRTKVAAAPVSASSATSASPRSRLRPVTATAAPSRTAARATPGADALGAAADQHDLAVEERHGEQRATGSPGAQSGPM